MSEKKSKNELMVKVAEISEFLTELNCPYCSGDGCDLCNKNGISKGALRANELLGEVWKALESELDKEQGKQEQPTLEERVQEKV